MLTILPAVVSMVAGILGWKLGRLVGLGTGAILAIIGVLLGLYYGVKLRRALNPLEP